MKIQEIGTQLENMTVLCNKQFITIQEQRDTINSLKAKFFPEEDKEVFGESHANQINKAWDKDCEDREMSALIAKAKKDPTVGYV